MNESSKPSPSTASGFVRDLGLLDATMLVAGSMIGSGIFIVSADIARLVGSSGWLLATWVATGLLTLGAALSYGALAERMPHAGGQYVYLRDLYSPLWGFLYGWAFFLVIQSGTIAAVAVAFAKFLGVLTPTISPSSYLIAPINVSHGYALSLSVQQAVGIAMIVLLTALNSRGLKLGKLIQNVFTSAKTLALAALIVVGLVFGWNAEVVHANFADAFTPKGADSITAGAFGAPTLDAAAGVLGLIVAMCVAQVGSLFSSDAWNNITFMAGEVREPKRTIPRALAMGTGIVTLLYVLATLAYLVVLPLEAIKHAPEDRVATAVLKEILGSNGAAIMAVAIVISTFGCNNGLILSGARVTHAMANDGLFFRKVGTLNAHRVPAVGLWIQCIWASLLVLPRTRKYDDAGAVKLDAAGNVDYGNLYSNLLDYVVASVLVFYLLTIVGVFVMRKRDPTSPRSIGYPWLPAFYILGAGLILAVLVVYRTDATWPGIAIVASGVPVYALWRKLGTRQPA